MFVGLANVDAKNVFYTNEYGVRFTEEQYDFFSRMYYDGYQKFVTSKDFNYFDVNYMKPNLVETIYEVMPMDTSFTGTKKTLKISKINSTSGTLIIVVVDWFKNPSTRSNDVIGARFVGTNLIEAPSIKMINNSGVSNFTNIDIFSNGFGQTFLLSGTSIKRVYL